MWLNFKSDNQNGGQGRRIPLSSPIGKGVSRGIDRQSSTRSSTRSAKSLKSSSSGNNLLRKLDEHELKTKTLEWQKNQDYKMIRDRRKAIRKQIDAKLKVVRRLYIPSILGVIFGIVFLFGATIRSLGEGTFVWNFREQFKIIGPILIVLGVILLLTTVGLESHSLEKLKKAGVHEVKPVIHPDFFNEKTRYDRQESKQSSSSYDPNCSTLEKHRLLWKNSNTDEEDGFLCSSIASASSGVIQKEKKDPMSRRSKSVTIKLINNCNDIKDKKRANTADDNVFITQSDARNFREMIRVPSIEVTDVDEISCKFFLPSAAESGTLSRSPSVR